MRTLSEVLREADPLGDEPRRAQERRISQKVLDRRRLVEHPPKRRAAIVTVAVLAVMGIAAVAFNWSHGAENLVAAVRFEVRLAEENRAPGLREVALAGTDRKIYLHQEIVIANDDIAQAQIVEGPGASMFSIGLTFNEEGAMKMLRATQNHVGRPLAILIDGEVVLAPVVRSPISRLGNINGSYARADAERIVAGILGR